MAYMGVNRFVAAFALPISTPISGATFSIQTTRDIYDLGGRGRISGTVRNSGTPDFPVWRRVRLLCKRDGRLIRETWSDPVTGAYEFLWIAEGLRYFVVAHDHTGQYNAEISDDIMPEPMP